MSKRARWARRADEVAKWFGLESKGTSVNGKARLAFTGAIVETRSLLRSSALVAAGKTEEIAKAARLPWIQILFSQRTPDRVALLVDRATAEDISRYLARRWTFSGKTLGSSETDSSCSVGGTE